MLPQFSHSKTGVEDSLPVQKYICRKYTLCYGTLFHGPIYIVEGATFLLRDFLLVQNDV
jgi:hypothetical protein